MNVVAPTSAGQVSAPWSQERRLVVAHVSWEDYEKIGEAFRDRPALRLTYDRGSLELMTTSQGHEVYKQWLGRFVETIAEELGRPLAPGGNMTFRRPDLERGLEADQCYWIEHEPQVRGRLAWDPIQDPPPDLALEIEVSRSALDRMAVYAALRVPEVWRYDGETLQVHVLQADGTYRLAERSPTFPQLPLQEIARFLQPDGTTDYLGVVRAFRAWVREQLAKPQGLEAVG